MHRGLNVGIGGWAAWAAWECGESGVVGLYVPAIMIDRLAMELQYSMQQADALTRT